MKSIKVLVFTIGLVLIASPICARAGLAIDFANPTVDLTNGNWSLGWAFTVNEPIAVDALGFYDDLQNGLTQLHDVAIFDAAQAMVVSGQVAPGDPLISWWRWTAVTPTVLVPGMQYQIQAVTGAENYTWAPIGFVVDPRVNYQLDSYFTPPGGMLVYPDASDRVVGYFGPNFSITRVVPVPGSLLLLVPGLLGVIGLRRKLA